MPLYTLKKRNLKSIIRRFLERINPRKGKPHQPSQSQLPQPRYVLLRGKAGNVFWTTDDGSNHEAEGYTVLHRGTDSEEMAAKWSEWYYGRYDEQY
jgi:hypothetical protein